MDSIEQGTTAPVGAAPLESDEAGRAALLHKQYATQVEQGVHRLVGICIFSSILCLAGGFALGSWSADLTRAESVVRWGKINASAREAVADAKRRCFLKFGVDTPQPPHSGAV